MILILLFNKIVVCKLYVYLQVSVYKVNEYGLILILILKGFKIFFGYF